MSLFPAETVKVIINYVMTVSLYKVLICVLLGII